MKENKNQIKLDDVYLHSMDDQIPTKLIHNNRIYELIKEAKVIKEPKEKKETLPQKSKTEELNELAKKKEGKKRKKGLPKGIPVYEMAGGIRVYENPLNEIRKLKEPMGAENVNPILLKYSPGAGDTTLAAYRSQYKQYIEKVKSGEIKEDYKVLKYYETITSKNIESIREIIQFLVSKNKDATLIKILEEVDMTENKAKDILKKLEKSNTIRKYRDPTDGKEKYALVTSQKNL